MTLDEQIGWKRTLKLEVYDGFKSGRDLRYEDLNRRELLVYRNEP